VSGFDVIAYQDQAAQYQQEFSRGMIKKESCQDLKIINPAGKHVMFKTIETVEITDGHQQVMGIAVIMEKEAAYK